MSTPATLAMVTLVSGEVWALGVALACAMAPAPAATRAAGYAFLVRQPAIGLAMLGAAHGALSGLPPDASPAVLVLGAALAGFLILIVDRGSAALVARVANQPLFPATPAVREAGHLLACALADPVPDGDTVRAWTRGTAQPAPAAPDPGRADRPTLRWLMLQARAGAIAVQVLRGEAPPPCSGDTVWCVLANQYLEAGYPIGLVGGPPKGTREELLDRLAAAIDAELAEFFANNRRLLADAARAIEANGGIASHATLRYMRRAVRGHAYLVAIPPQTAPH